MLWFAEEVLPRIRRELQDVELLAAGLNSSAAIARLSGRGVRLLGPVPDLRSLYGTRRVFVAPTRFAAGLPLKVCEAAAHGIPVVGTGLIARQLGWQAGRDLLVGDDAESFARACIRLHTDADTWAAVRAAALRQVRSQCSRERFRSTVAALLSPAPHTAAVGTDIGARQAALDLNA
jgi:glycosyltransferase involved in cell wall biosynthesis